MLLILTGSSELKDNSSNIICRAENIVSIFVVVAVVSEVSRRSGRSKEGGDVVVVVWDDVVSVVAIKEGGLSGRPATAVESG